MAGLYAPLPTLRRRPRGRLRTDRGRRGLLLLHRSGLSPHTPCQSPGALTHVAACLLARSPNRDFYPKASDTSSPPCLLRSLPAGALARRGLHPLETRRLVTAHMVSRRPPSRRSTIRRKEIGSRRRCCEASSTTLSLSIAAVCRSSPPTGSSVRTRSRTLLLGRVTKRQPASC